MLSHQALIGHMKTDGHLGRCLLKAATATLPTSFSPSSATTFASSLPG